jgi:hypothetical protein
MEPQPEIIGGHIVVPDRPGIGIDIAEDVVAEYPSRGNVSPPSSEEEYVYFRAREGRARWVKE